jgi:hypothetical protein
MLTTTTNLSIIILWILWTLMKLHSHGTFKHYEAGSWEFPVAHCCRLWQQHSVHRLITVVVQKKSSVIEIMASVFWKWRWVSYLWLTCSRMFVTRSKSWPPVYNTDIQCPVQCYQNGAVADSSVMFVMQVQVFALTMKLEFFWQRN